MNARVQREKVRTRRGNVIHNKELHFISSRFVEIYEGNPSYGRCAVQLLAPITDELAFQKWQGLSIHGLLWQMISRREFVIDLLQQKKQLEFQYTDPFDWRQMRYRDKTLWQMLLDRLQTTQEDLQLVLLQLNDEVLEKKPPAQDKNFRRIIHGMLEHDVHCLAQIQVLYNMVISRS